MTPDEVRILFAYDRWANARLLASAAALRQEEVARDLGGSHRSILIALRHILWGGWLWLGRWRERGPAGPSPLECGDLTALAARWRELERAQHEFLSGLAPADLARPIGYENPPGTRWTYALGDMLRHVVNHSTYHRGQVAAMLRSLGAEPPPTDYLVFLDEHPGDRLLAAVRSPAFGGA